MRWVAETGEGSEDRRHVERRHMNMPDQKGWRWDAATGIGFVVLASLGVAGTDERLPGHVPVVQRVD